MHPKKKLCLNCFGLNGDNAEFGTWAFETGTDPIQQYNAGRISFAFFGQKLYGEFALVKMKGQKRNWRLIKANDRFAEPDWILETVLPPKPSKSKAGKAAIRTAKTKISS
jgi:hypothetical protein